MKAKKKKVMLDFTNIAGLKKFYSEVDEDEQKEEKKLNNLQNNKNENLDHYY